MKWGGVWKKKKHICLEICCEPLPIYSKQHSKSSDGISGGTHSLDFMPQHPPSTWHSALPNMAVAQRLARLLPQPPTLPTAPRGDPTGNSLLCSLYPKSTKWLFFSRHEQEGDPKAARFPWERAGFWSRSAPTQQVVFTGHARVTPQASSPKKNRTGAKKKRKIQKKKVQN